MTRTCASCGFEPGPSARYCERCGSALWDHPGPDTVRVEARHATILFCDVVQSTRLATGLDLEDQRALFKSFWRAVGQIVRRHEGDVTRFVGDGAVASFGYPLAQEDAAERAVRAGLELVEAFREGPPGPQAGSMRLRVGIAGGMVALGERIDEAAVAENAILGSVPYLAARLMAEAPPGGVVIADAVRRQAGGYFSYRDLGALALRGFAEPQRAWLVLGASETVSRFAAGQRTGMLPLVGRDAMLARLLQAWERCRAGRLAVCELVGEPGIGKSRLVEAFRDAVAASGGGLVTMDCFQRHALTPLHPAQAQLRRWAGIEAQDDPATRRQRTRQALEGLLGAEAAPAALDRLAGLIGLPRPDELSGELEREQSIAVLIELICAAAAKRPTLLVCEDLHWADPSTVTLMHRLAAGEAPVPLLLLVTRRLDSDMPALPGVEAWTVEPLDEADSRKLVHLAREGRTLDEAVAEQIVERSGGVPLYLEELTHHALQGGQAPAADAELSLPARVDALIQARLDRQPRLRPVAQAAAVAGREFPAQLLECLLDGQLPIGEALQQLQGARVLVPGSSPQRWQFRHALIQDAVYRSLLRNDRQSLHQRAARALGEHFAGQPDGSPDVVGHHLAAAGRDEEAAACFLAAGAEASARAAYVESVGHARAGLQCAQRLPEGPGRSACLLQLHTQLALALAATHGYAAPEVEQAYGRARELCTPDVPATARFAVARGMATFYIVRCRLNTADELARQCMELSAAEARDPSLEIEALTAVGYTRTYLGDLAGGRRALEHCLALYEAHDGSRFRYPSAQDPAVAAASLLPVVDWLQGDEAAADRHMARAMAAAERRARPFDLAYAACYAAKLANLRGRWDEALRHAGHCVDLSTRHGLGTWQAAGTMQSAVAMAASSDPARGAATLRHVLTLFMQAGAELNAPYFLWGVALGERARGEPAAARAAIAEALQRSASSSEVYLRPMLLLTAAELAPTSETAQALLAEAATTAAAQGATALWQRARGAANAVA